MTVVSVRVSSFTCLPGCTFGACTNKMVHAMVLQTLFCMCLFGSCAVAHLNRFCLYFSLYVLLYIIFHAESFLVHADLTFACTEAFRAYDFLVYSPGLWVPPTFLLVVLFFACSLFTAALGRGAWRIPPFCLQPRVNESILPFLQFSVVGTSLLGHLYGCGSINPFTGPPLWLWVSGLKALLLCCCPRT